MMNFLGLTLRLEPDAECVCVCGGGGGVGWFLLSCFALFEVPCFSLVRAEVAGARNHTVSWFIFMLPHC